MKSLAVGCANTKKRYFLKIIKNTLKEVLKDNDLQVIYVQVTFYWKN